MTLKGNQPSLENVSLLQSCHRAAFGDVVVLDGKQFPQPEDAVGDLANLEQSVSRFGKAPVSAGLLGFGCGPLLEQLFGGWLRRERGLPIEQIVLEEGRHSGLE